jgi:hypothetical protein
MGFPHTKILVGHPQHIAARQNFFMGENYQFLTVKKDDSALALAKLGALPKLAGKIGIFDASNLFYQLPGQIFSMKSPNFTNH